jgi:hypothetical protein
MRRALRGWLGITLRPAQKRYVGETTGVLLSSLKVLLRHWTLVFN